MRILSCLLLTATLVLAGNFDPNHRLIKVSATATPQWMNERDINRLHKLDVKFVDITDTQGLEKKAWSIKRAKPVIPTSVTQQQTVNPLLQEVNDKLMKETLMKLTQFKNRYYRSPSGAESSNYLFEQVKSIAASSTLNVTVTQVKHSWSQNSIVARIEGQGGNQETVIVGAHQDSVNQSDPQNGVAPGADDDGSGTVTIIEAFRVLVASKFQPSRPVEFQWYSGEEGGLLGSRDIAKQYQSSSRVVASMLQLDMTGYPIKDRPDIGFVTDNVDAGLTQFLRVAAQEYLSAMPRGDFKCGYGCSDHASWNAAGYASAFAFESTQMRNNRNIHSTRDTYDTIDFNHMQKFSKLAVAYVVELAH